MDGYRRRRNPYSQSADWQDIDIEVYSGDRYSLPANSILCLYNDKSNNMWAGSVRNGLINIKEVGMKTYQDVLPTELRAERENNPVHLSRQ